MKYYKLTPKEEILETAFWNANSVHFESAIVQADDEMEARCIAEMNYGISYEKDISSKGIWLNKYYVDADEIDGYLFNQLIKPFEILSINDNHDIFNATVH
ncbi:MAG: hypothetical protein EP298_06110 [Gammaproteobacteria bacterium]|nr:MAG: hypothetical protein EP298_06110 [Gammaproteobacteria bacterium]UTW41468.1 hypothetical protein KFE69_08065 [bacterium SCSIO 12844]